MTQIYALATLWIGLALIAVLLSIWLRVANAMSEIVVGTVAQLIIGAALGATALGTDQSWIKFLASSGAVLLTFLAGAELDPQVMRREWKQAVIVGLVAFIAPFLGCAAVARYALHWSSDSSWLAGIALSTTSVAVVYAVMLELGLNRTAYGKGILAACFVNDLATVIGLGVLFAPFTWKTLVFVLVSVASFALLPWLTPRFFRRYGNRPSELEAKFLLLTLFALGALALWSGSEPVLPAYIVGMILAGTVGKDHALIRRLRTLTLGLLTPFYFIRAGSFVSLSALAAAPLTFVILLLSKMVTKFGGVFPVTKLYRQPQPEATYHADDVDRTDFRQHQRAVRLHAPHRGSSAVLLPGGHRGRQRGSADVDRQQFLLATSPAAESRPSRQQHSADADSRGEVMIKHILLAYDGSAPADDAFVVALDLARQYHATLDVLAVAQPPDIAADVETEAWLEASTRDLRRMLKKLETHAYQANLSARFHVKVGHPAEQILLFAEAIAIDHIVIGHRGKNVLKRWLVGSVSSRVIDHATCSVTVVR